MWDYILGTLFIIVFCVIPAMVCIAWAISVS